MKTKDLNASIDWWENQIGLHAAVRLRNKHFPNLKVNEMLTEEQILLIWKKEIKSI